MKLYCVYLTIYRGNKMPPFYIGSSFTDKVLNRKYHGSVSSKKWMPIWKSELKDNPHLFESKIICTHDTRQEALDKECKLQVALDILKKPEIYINRSVARINGFFGMSVKGKKESAETRRRKSISLKGKNTGKVWSKEQKKRKSESSKGKNTRKGIIIVTSDETRKKMSSSHTGVSLSEDHKNKMSESKIKFWDDPIRSANAREKLIASNKRRKEIVNGRR